MSSITMPLSAPRGSTDQVQQQPRSVAHRISLADPRWYQIASLSLLLLYGMTGLHFDVSPERVMLTMSAVFFSQWAFSYFFKLKLDLKSAAISGLSLCLLLRSNSPVLVIVAALITIGSKFLIRWNGKHLFNPTNFGIVIMMIFSQGVWVSPGQWGSFAFFAFLIACLGGVVINRARRSDVTFAFLAFYAALLFGRSLLIGEPAAIPLHRMESGALLLFAFFMISDPKTTPDSRAGRIIFAFLVAFGAWYITFRLFRTNGLLWSLALFSAFVPLIDRLLPGRKYLWSQQEPAAAALENSPSTSTLTGGNQ